jgi:pseudouridine-5'-phosphate glycosidase/sugar/nucleoside kinase (ribokinase family)
MELVITEEIRAALSTGYPGVVALESTIITHGMPYPVNLSTARSVEQIIRQNGAIPATIAILNGKIHIGLTDTELEALAQGKYTNISKVSRRDISRVVSSEGSGSTTVAATVIIARMAGIRVFATGGIGGVHRGAEESWDVSADLTELGRTPVLVVCAGAKSILDLPKTIEVLETMGVAVIGWQTNEFPAFFTPKSGLPTSGKCNDELEMAKICSTQFDHLKLNSGILLTCRVPVESAGPADLIERATRQAVTDARSKNISGKDLTPFLLREINKQTQGASLQANIALISNNAMIAAQVAREYAQFRRVSSSASSPLIQVIGGVCMDTIATPSDPTVYGETKSSFPGKVEQSLGGVGRNVARTILQLTNKSTVSFLTAIGQPSPTTMVIEAESDLAGWRLDRLEQHRSAQYTAIMNGDGSLCSAVVDMDGLFDEWKIDMSTVNLTRSKLLVVDANLSERTLAETTRHAAHSNVSVWGDGVSVAKCRRLIPSLEYMDSVKLNMDELAVFVPRGGTEDSIPWIASGARVLFEEHQLKPSARILVSMGKHGAALVGRGTASSPNFTVSIDNDTKVSVSTHIIDGIRIVRYDAPPLATVVNCTGAGDTLIGATAWSNIIEGLDIEKSVIVGLLAARITLMSPLAVSENISAEKFVSLIEQLRTVPIQSKL